MNPQRNPPRPQQQLPADQAQKQREFLMQQQRLRLMASTNTQKAVSADALIENLLAKKETFKLSDPLPSSTFASTSAEKAVEAPKFQQTQYDSRRAPKAASQQAAVDWLSPKSPSFPDLYRKVFSLVGEPDGMVDTGKIFPVLLTSGLNTDLLGYIWGLVNRCVAGKLTENELYAVLALVALAQKGYSFNSASVLSLVPQPPIPTLNLGADPQTPSKMRRQDLNLPSTLPGAQPLQGVQGLQTSPAIQGSQTLQSVQGPQGSQSLQGLQVLPPSPLSLAFPLDPSANFSQPSTFDSQASTFNSKPATFNPQPSTFPSKPSTSIPTFEPSSSVSDDFDDFTDFQSATASVPVVVPTPVVGSQKSKPVAAVMADPLSLPEPVFVQKFPVASGTRGVGSRLANHSLGSSKQANHGLVASKTTNHGLATSKPTNHGLAVSKPTNHSLASSKPTNHSLASSKPANHSLASSKPTNHSLASSKPANHGLAASRSALAVSKPPKPRHKHRPSPPRFADDDFSDFQQAGRTHGLPESDLLETQETSRSHSAVSDLAASGSITSKLGASRSEEPDFGLPNLGLSSGSLNPPAPGSLDLAGSIHPAPSELMAVEEDRYGALRALSLFALNANEEVALETPIAEDSFAAIATRAAPQRSEIDQSKLGQSSLTEGALAAARFEVDDWGAFETAPPTEPIPVFPAPADSGLGAGLDGWQNPVDNLAIHGGDLDFSLPALTTKPIETHWTSGLLDSLDTSLPNPLDSSLANPIVAGLSNPNLHRQDDDDFGDFVSPNAWTEGAKDLDTLSWQEEPKDVEVAGGLWLEDIPTSAVHPWPEEAKTKPLDNPLVSQLWGEEGKGGDSQSVSSLELPGLEHAWDAVGEWRRCLQSCLGILQFAVDTFDALTDSKVLAEVLGSERGQSYLKDLVEVWYICERIATSYHKTGLDQKIDALLNSTTTMWSLLKPHYNQAMIAVESDLTATGPDMCSVCLADGASVDFEGHSYHPPCANLWLNNIDTALPALHQP